MSPPRFPTFNELETVYSPPSEEKKLLYPAARKAIENLRDTLLDLGGTYASDAEAIKTFRGVVGEMLPVAHQTATAAHWAVEDVRMYSTRYRGGARLVGATQDDYRRALEGAILALDVAVARAIFSQP